MISSRERLCDRCRGGGYLPHAETFTIPSGLNNPDLRQVVKLNRGKENESMILENYFYPVDLASTQTPSDIIAADYTSAADSSSMMVVKINNKEILVTKPGSGQKEEALAENDADSANTNIIRIEKDEYDPTLEKNLSQDDIRQKDEESKRAQELAEDEKAPKYDVTISNQELASIAAIDARTARAESDSLKKEVARLNSTADEKSNLAESYVNKALKAEDTEKLIFQNKAYELRTESENLRRQATDLQIAATAKENEAVSSEQDAKALMEAIDTQALADNKKGGKKGGKSANTGNVVVSENPTSTSETTSNESATDKSAPALDKSETSSTESAKNDSSLPSKDVKNDVSNADSKSVTESVVEKKSDNGKDSPDNTPSKENADTKKSDTDLAINTASPNSSNAVKSGTEQTNPATASPNAKNSTEVNNTGDNSGQTASDNASKQDASTAETKSIPVASEKSNVSANAPADADNSNASVEKEKLASNDNANTESNNQVQQNNSTDSQSKTESVVQSPSVDKEHVVDSKSSNPTVTESKVESTTVKTETQSQPSDSRPADQTSAAPNQDQSKTSQADMALNTSEKTTAVESTKVNESSTESKSESTNDKISPDDKVVSKPNEAASPKSSTKPSSDNSVSKQEEGKLNQSQPKGNKAADKSSDLSSPESNPNRSADLAVNNKQSDPNTLPATNKETENNTNPSGTNSDSNVAISSTEIGTTSPDSVYQSKAELKQFELPPVSEARPSMPADINARKAQPVKEEARLAYQEYKRKYSTSQRLAEQSIDLQKRIAVTPVSPERDSLIFVSNELSQQSADMWKESVAQLDAAKQIDPNVKEKMELNEQIVAYNSSLPVSNANDRTTKVDATQSNQSTPNSSNTTEDVTSAQTSAETTASQEKDETMAMVNTPSPVKEEVVLTPPLTQEEAKQVEEATNFEVQTPNGTEKIKISTEGLDTRHPDFPTYVELNKEITHKQVETITVFAEAVNLNKKAVDEKQEQGRLMDLAETQTDIQKKAKIFVQADSMKALSQADMKLAEEKFKVAQSKTGDVKQVTAQMEEVKSRIAIPGAKVSTQSTASIVHPEQQQTEIASDFAEAQKQEVVPVTQNTPAETKQDNANNQLADQSSNPSDSRNNNNQSSPSDINTNANTSSNQPTNSVSPQSGSVTASVTPEEKEAFSKNSFSISDKPVYSESNPIPMNPQLPEGLVFKVQIGAFHNQIPAEKFKGVQPITGETTRPGWIRYCVGLFQTFEPANIVKKEMQGRGFKDAFVVAYYNGKRIDLSEAYAMLTKGADKLGKDYVATSRKEMALLRANDIRPEKIASVRKGEVGQDEKSFYGNDAAKEMNSIAAVEYAVQVGVYRSSTAPRVLAPLMPLLTEQIRANLYRFTTDHFSDYATADSMKRVARRNGVKMLSSLYIATVLWLLLRQFLLASEEIFRQQLL
ncbi:MAG: hypothetical protein IPP51_08595 [Bacteroidetes bacterium]|nr:hypothetical protein [Bacteroidota bacterium]